MSTPNICTEPLPEIKVQFSQLCQDLNLDQATQTQTWELYQKVQDREPLPRIAKPLHWLTCSLYVVCSQSKIETLSGVPSKGSGISLVQILRQSQLSLAKFFSLIKTWSERIHLGPEDYQQIMHLENKFLIVQDTFRKYKQSYLQLFEPPSNFAIPKSIQPGIKQQKARSKLPCTSYDLFNFGWSLFVLAKMYYPPIADSMLHSLHLLLNLFAMLYTNVLTAKRYDLLNKKFPGLPSNYKSIDFIVCKLPPIYSYLINNDSNIVEGTNRSQKLYWEPFLTELHDKGLLSNNYFNFGPDETQMLSHNDYLDSTVFHSNLRSIVNTYEHYVLNDNQLDERIFLKENNIVEVHVGSLPKMENLSILENTPDIENDMSKTCLKPPATPLTSRSLISEKKSDFTPFTATTYETKWLEDLYSTTGIYASDKLCNDLDKIDTLYILTEFEKHLETNLNLIAVKFTEENSSSINLTNMLDNYSKLCRCLYYRILELIVKMELKNTQDSAAGLILLLKNESFHRTVTAICMEIVLFTHNSQKLFPWIIEILSLNAYVFCQLIHHILVFGDFLTRSVMKHLGGLEERILEELVWKSHSQIWDMLKNTEQSVPAYEEVMPKEHRNLLESGLLSPRKQRQGIQMIQRDLPYPLSSSYNSPYISAHNRQNQQMQSVMTPVRPVPLRLGTDHLSSSNKNFQDDSTETEFTAKKEVQFRRLSIDLDQNNSDIIQIRPPTPTDMPEISGVSLRMSAMSAVGSHQTSELNKSIAQTPPTIRRHVDLTTFSSLNPSDPNLFSVDRTLLKPQKKGSSALFYRKVYLLAYTRLKHLSDTLKLDVILLQKIWTTFEYCLRQHIYLFKDRHLDQILLSCVYIVIKVMKFNLKFGDILVKYRTQPQANSMISRSVLLNNDLTNKECKIPYGLRADIVQFYNQVFVTEMQNFTKGLVAEISSESPTLSPLPFHLSISLPKFHRVRSNDQSIFVKTQHTRSSCHSGNNNSQHKIIVNPMFSPNRDVKALNRAISERGQCKRKIEMRENQANDDVISPSSLLSPAKRPAAPFPMQRESMIRLLQEQMSEFAHNQDLRQKSSKKTDSSMEF